jgi:hypothetical protein
LEKFRGADSHRSFACAVIWRRWGILGPQPRLLVKARRKINFLGQEEEMKTIPIAVSAVLVCSAPVLGTATAQGVPQTVAIAHVNVQQLPAGYRASKIIGSNVVNDGNESIGKIDDLLVSSDGRPPFAILSVGGFLGIDSHYVVVPYQNLSLVNEKIVLPGATKDTLKMLPEFKYAAK